MFLRAGLRISGISVALLMLGSLLAPSAAATVGYYLNVTVQFGSSSIHVGEATSLVITVTGQLPTSAAGSDGMAVSYYTPGGGADHGIVLSNGGGSCPYNYLFANQMAGEQAGPTIDCTITATVTGVSVGPHNTSVEADGLTFIGANFDGYSATAAADIAVVAYPPSIGASFVDPTVEVGHTDTLSFQIANPSGNGTLTGVGFTSTLPSGLTVASSTSSVCGGTLTVTSPHSISLAGASIDSDSDCQVQLDVTGAAAGTWGVATSQVSSVEGGNGTAASASVTVVKFAPPTIQAEFGKTSLPVGGTTSLSFTVTNPNAPVQYTLVKPAVPDPHTLTGVGFTDTLPSGLVVADPNGVTGSCGGGTITATAGGPTISLSGATLAAGASCTFSVGVVGLAAGTYQDSTGPVGSTQGGPGDPATATITVAALSTPTPAPTTVVLGATAAPTTALTPPPTSTVDSRGSGGNAPLLPLLALTAIAGLLVTGLLLRPETRVRRR